MRMNLSEAVHTWAIRRGDTLALSGSRNLTYGQLDSLANIYAQHIITTLPTSVERIAILTDDNIQFVSFLLGIIRSGNVFVLINPTLSDEQINRSLRTIHCKYYIADGPMSNIDAQYIPLCGKKDLDGVSHSRLLYPSLGVTEEAGIIFSSGTTGEPKAITRSSFSILSEVVQWVIELQLQIGTSFLIPRPLYYTGGFILMYASLFSGGRVDLLDDLSCKNILNYIQNESNDWAFIVPSVIREMITYPNYDQMAKNVLTMGSFIYSSEKKAFHEKFKCNVIEVWGNSEGLGTITEPADLYNHPTSIGRPFFTDFLDISEDNNVLISGNREGLIFGISDNEFSEYIGRPALTNEVLHDGFIYSEDIGYKDENGYFYLTGRVKDIIVIDGIKVFPADIEKELLYTEKVTDCAVFSVTDSYGNECISAAVVMRQGASAKDAILTTNSKLAPHERIRHYIVLNIIPRNHGGKIDRNAILIQFEKACEVAE